MRHLVSAACGLFIGASGAAWSQGADGAASPVVVELYTSQGCSSCPPADDFMLQLSQDPDVIALALHVDYWDYIGWQDTFADPAFTQRQKSYAKAVGSRMIYTPQMIIGGLDRIEGNDPLQVADAIRRHQTVVSPVTLSVTRQGDRLVIRAVANPPLTKPAQVQVVRYTPEARVLIERGENQGREVTYTNIVTDWQSVAEWPGTAPFEFTTPLAGADPVVVLIQTSGPAEVLASAALR